ncbi:MAG: 2-oxoglutarate dehydrogenase complex dihydrolipoyllysine-residue succinyltransferase [Verrucomicrobiota bacterium]
MAIEIKVPSVGESVTEVEIADWLKQEGDLVQRDEVLLVIESDKATVEVSAPVTGRLGKILKGKRTKATVGEVVGLIEEGSPATVPATPAPSVPAAKPAASKEPMVMPAAARLLAEKNLPVSAVTPTGPGGRVLKEDVQRTSTAKPETPTPTVAPVPPPPPAAPEAFAPTSLRPEEVVPMSLLRRRIAERLLHAQATMAMLTTFNEVDMSAIMGLRERYQEKFLERYQIKLGMMSFFVKATIEALKEHPALNAEIRGSEMVYRHYFDIGIAVGGVKGLVVPVLRNAERMGLAEIEKAIADFAKRIKENKILPDELQGGTFTITNGGVFGSLMSTPIINPPQSGVLGMHTIQERPVALNGQVVIRPMMYLALTYDHRIVDGRDAVLFLRRIKEIAEDPVRLMLEI